MFSYRKSYYLTHPWKWVSDVYWGIRNLWHRARYGYAYVDAWNMNTAWCHMGANMLIHLANKGGAYPGNEEFDTPEKWKAHLQDMAMRLEKCANINWDDENEYWDEYAEDFNNEELRQKWRERDMELKDARDSLIKETFEILGKNFDLYWD